MKFEVCMIKLLSPWYKAIPGKYHSFVASGIVTLRTRNNTDGNKLVIFSGIALYHGDTYILFTKNVRSLVE